MEAVARQEHEENRKNIRYCQKSYEKNTLRREERQTKPSPLRGEGKGGGEEQSGKAKTPLTLTLSHKGRGEITFDNTI